MDPEEAVGALERYGGDVEQAAYELVVAGKEREYLARGISGRGRPQCGGCGCVKRQRRQGAEHVQAVGCGRKCGHSLGLITATEISGARCSGQARFGQPPAAVRHPHEPPKREPPIAQQAQGFGWRLARRCFERRRTTLHECVASSSHCIYSCARFAFENGGGGGGKTKKK